jgi:phosphohistidine phosphatase
MRNLLVLRHAHTENTRPGSTDHARRLTSDGRRQAEELGSYLRDQAVRVDRVLCSSAIRAQQTLEALGLDGFDSPADVTDELYNAGGDTILALIRAQDEEAGHLLVVGHAPGLPSVVFELADPATSDHEAMATLDGRFPAGTLAVLRTAAAWSDLAQASLVSVRLP